MLEEGEESDFYDFLELYIRRWQLVARKIKYDCDRRRLETTAGLRGLSQEDDRSLFQIPLHPDENATYAPMQNITRDFFEERPFHPYDWYVRPSKIGSRVRSLMLTLSLPGTFEVLAIITIDTKGLRQSLLVSTSYIGE